MNDPGTFIGRSGQASEAMEQRIDQRASRMTGGRVNDHERGLIDDDDVLVFVDHVDRDRLRFGTQRLRQRARRHLYRLTGAGTSIHFGDRAV